MQYFFTNPSYYIHNITAVKINSSEVQSADIRRSSVTVCPQGVCKFVRPQPEKAPSFLTTRTILFSDVGKKPGSQRTTFSLGIKAKLSRKANMVVSRLKTADKKDPIEESKCK